MNLKLLSCASVLLCSFVSLAEPAKPETVELFLKVTDAAATVDYAYAQLDQMSEQMVLSQAPEAKNDPLVRKHLQELNQLIRTELSWQQLEQPMIAIYSSVFTEAELQGIIAFYQSEAGQKMVKRQPELIQASMAVMQEQSMLLMPKIKQLVEKQSQERMEQSQKN
ncbi:MAG: DUF2059 domain-containing protein [Gammaproteobacteria bacterium]|nr:DUF2059 domain-containing protein [Gammaproteobacteria bacterium]